MSIAPKLTTAVFLANGPQGGPKGDVDTVLCVEGEEDSQPPSRLTSPGSKRPSRDSGDPFHQRGSSAPFLSSEERVSPDSAFHSDGLTESHEKPLKIMKKEKSAEREATSEEDEGDEPPLFPLRPLAANNMKGVPAAKAGASRGVGSSGGSTHFRFPCAVAAPPTTRGAVTTLHSIAQLAELVTSNKGEEGGRERPTAVVGAVGSVSVVRARPQGAVSPSPPLVQEGGRAHASPPAPSFPSPLTLRKGETVLLLLHRGRGSLAELINRYTEHLSQIRIFTLDLSTLPPQEYEDVEGDGARMDPVDGGPGGSQGGGEGVMEEEEEEEEALFVAGRTAPDTQQLLRQRNSLRRSSHGGDAQGLLSLFPAAGRCMTGGTGELSDELSHVAETVLNRVSRLLRAETILNRNFFQSEPHETAREVDDDRGGSPNADDKDTHKERAETLLLPAMVLWRAAGAEAADYSPYLPCSYSDGSTPTLSQQQQRFSVFPRRSASADVGALAAAPPQRYRHFGDYLCVHGGPLVAKQVHVHDQVHSFSLYSPVYTVAHLYKHILEAAKTAVWKQYKEAAEPLRPFSLSAELDTMSTAASEGTCVEGAAQRFFALLDREPVKSRTLVYFGASWCPPCMRIVSEMPLLIKENFSIPDDVMSQLSFASAAKAATGALSPSSQGGSMAKSNDSNDGKALHVFVKADMDLAKPLFDLFGVNVIPVFLLLDNTKLFELERRLLTERQEAAAKGRLPHAVSESEEEKVIGDALLRSELGRLQNSHRDMINVFIEKHCTSLRFDEDF